MKRKPMPEKEYRASRVCRVLGNPTAYQIMKLLINREKITPSEIAKELGLTIANVSKTLRSLRQIDLVRYDTERYLKRYYIKDEIILDVLSTLEKYVEKIKLKKF